MTQLLETVLKTLQGNGLYINLKKSRFGFGRISYLGFLINEHGINPDSNKVEAVHKLKTVGYFRQFIKRFATRSEPLTRLLRKTNPWNWSMEQQAAFEDLKSALFTTPMVLQF